MFILSKGENKKPHAMEDLRNVVASAMEKLDKTDKRIAYIQEENERAGQLALKILQMLAPLQCPTNNHAA